MSKNICDIKRGKGNIICKVKEIFAAFSQNKDEIKQTMMTLEYKQMEMLGEFHSLKGDLLCQFYDIA